MKNCIILLLFISSFQFSISNRKQTRYNTIQLKRIIDILKKQFTDEFEGQTSINHNRANSNNNFKESENYETEVDPNDHVDIELWNKL
ncbi:unnamed protein product, partial [Rotaria sp. Silwood2]